MARFGFIKRFFSLIIFFIISLILHSVKTVVVIFAYAPMICNHPVDYIQNLVEICPIVVFSELFRDKVGYSLIQLGIPNSLTKQL